MIVAVAVIAGTYLVASVTTALVIGRAIRQADEREPDWLADQPVEVLSPVELRRRFRLIAGDAA